jgi:hypothetical protein
MKKPDVSFKQFFFRFWSWNLVLDLITLVYVIYVCTLFPDVEKGIYHIIPTLLACIISCIRLLYILVIAIIKVVRGTYTQFFCLLGEFILLLLLTITLFWLLAFVFAGAVAAAGSGQ